MKKDIIVKVLVLVLLIFTSCGVRKSDIDYKKSSVEKEKITDLKKDVIEKSTVANAEASSSINSVDNDISETKMVQKTTEVFNANGSLNKRTVTTTSHIKKDRSKTKDSISTNKSGIRIDDFADHSELNEKYVSDSLVIAKTKTISADKTVVKNVGGRVMLIAIVIIIVTAFFLFIFIRKKKNAIKEVENLGI